MEKLFHVVSLSSAFLLVLETLYLFIFQLNFKVRDLFFFICNLLLEVLVLFRKCLILYNKVVWGLRSMTLLCVLLLGVLTQNLHKVTSWWFTTTAVRRAFLKNPRVDAEALLVDHLVHSIDLVAVVLACAWLFLFLLPFINEQLLKILPCSFLGPVCFLNRSLMVRLYVISWWCFEPTLILSDFICFSLSLLGDTLNLFCIVRSVNTLHHGAPLWCIKCSLSFAWLFDYLILRILWYWPTELFRIKFVFKSDVWAFEAESGNARLIGIRGIINNITYVLHRCLILTVFGLWVQ